MGRGYRTSTRTHVRARDLIRSHSVRVVSGGDGKVKTQLEAYPEAMERYWRNLAVAYAAGFVQSEQNGFLTLRDWCARTGRPDPTWHDVGIC
jgi:hypothetical protein